MRRLFAFFAVLCCTAVAQNAPTELKNPPTSEQRPTFQSGVNLVLVPVIVRNKQGQAIGDLSKDDFQIFDKGKRQAIVSFSE
jgi:hypothetical protein